MNALFGIEERSSENSTELKDVQPAAAEIPRVVVASANLRLLREESPQKHPCSRDQGSPRATVLTYFPMETSSTMAALSVDT